VIVRVSGEGQFELPDSDSERLNELDNRAVNAVEQGDETGSCPPTARPLRWTNWSSRP
jgi:hypothetical protein